MIQLTRAWVILRDEEGQDPYDFKAGPGRYHMAPNEARELATELSFGKVQYKPFEARIVDARAFEDLLQLVQDLQSEIRAQNVAVLEERERCALIIETKYSIPNDERCVALLEDAVAEIRNPQS